VRAWFTEVELDKKLASGADPAGSEPLAVRAEQLVDPERRAQMAETIERLLDDVERHPHGHPTTAHAPLRPESILVNRQLLTEVAANLQNGASLRGLAMAAQLVDDGSSSLYTGDEVRLQRELGSTLAALQA
jgi:hypothetical protein